MTSELLLSEPSRSLQSPCLWRFTTIWRYQQHKRHHTPESTYLCHSLVETTIYLFKKRFFYQIFTNSRFSLYKPITNLHFPSFLSSLIIESDLSETDTLTTTDTLTESHANNNRKSKEENTIVERDRNGYRDKNSHTDWKCYRDRISYRDRLTKRQTYRNADRHQYRPIPTDNFKNGKKAQSAEYQNFNVLVCFKFIFGR